MLELRPYQRQSVDALWTYFANYNGNPIVVLPTGCGKSLVLSQFCREAIEGFPSTRIVVATHVKELVSQDYLEFVELWPEAKAGIYSAGLNRRDTRDQVLFVGIQSVYNKAFTIQRCDLLVVDEAHMIPDSGLGMWRQFINDLLVINPQMKIIGLTATDYRMGSGALVEGDDRIFTDIAYEYPILKAFEEGYLCEVIPKHMDTFLDVSAVGLAGGEFKGGELERAVNIDVNTVKAVDEIIRYGEHRRSWLVFTAGNKHAHGVHARLEALGFGGACVTQETGTRERDAAVRAIKDGSIRYLVNSFVFTTGFNAKNIDLIADLGHTNSPGRHVQKVGRGTRPIYADGFDLSTRQGRLEAIAQGPKPNCLLLDFARNCDRHGPLDQIRGRRKKGKGLGDAPVKVCDKCHCTCFAGLRSCPDCNTPFPEPEIKVSASAGTAAVISTQVVPEWRDVIGMDMQRHAKPGKTPSLRVTYYTTDGKFSEWICFEHAGYAREKAVKWHKDRMSTDVPAAVDEALRIAYRQPSRILVKKDGEFWRVLNYEFCCSTLVIPTYIEPLRATYTWSGVELEEDEIPF